MGGATNIGHSWKWWAPRDRTSVLPASTTRRRILDVEGDLKSFRTFQQQPAQRQKSDSARLRRFMGTRSGRKIRDGTVLVDALDLDRVPLPLDRLLTYI
jgi:hypothetical protein